MKRIKYVSQFAGPMSHAELVELVSRAARKNTELGVTGVLTTSGRLFFQVLEGPDDVVDSLFATIAKDDRHTDVMLIREERGIDHRLFPDWSMRAVMLDAGSVEALEPLRAILETAAQMQARLNDLTGTLERALWTEVSKERTD